MAYDAKCQELAEYFLADDGSLTPARAAELAEAIQDAVEDWFTFNPKPDEGRTS